MYRGYQISEGLIMNLLNELNKCISCEPLVSIILCYSTSSIKLVMNLHEYLILYFSHTPQKELLIVKKKTLSPTPLKYNASTRQSNIVLIKCLYFMPLMKYREISVR